jgi:signal transduction histidine kinase
MFPQISTRLRSGEIINVAFALIVLVSLFSAISTMSNMGVAEITALLFLTTFYILMGIYGFNRILHSANPQLKYLYPFIQGLLGFMIIWFEKGSGFQALIFLPLVGQFVLLFEGFWIFIGNIFILGMYAIATFVLFGKIDVVISNVLTFFAGQIFVIIFTQMAVDEEKARINAEDLAQELTKANQQLKDYANQVEELAIEKERTRLAREIHDGIGHSLTTVFMQLQAALAIYHKEPQKAEKIILSAQGLTKDALNDVRNSISELRDSDLSEGLLSKRIKHLVSNLNTIGLVYSFRTLGKYREIPGQVKKALYRITQEGINNAIKHAHASKVSITLDYRESKKVTLILKDNGIGRDDIKSGYGLLGIEERMKLLKGEASFTSKKGHGFELKIEVPG